MICDVTGQVTGLIFTTFTAVETMFSFISLNLKILEFRFMGSVCTQFIRHTHRVIMNMSDMNGIFICAAFMHMVMQSSLRTGYVACIHGHVCTKMAG